MKTPKQELSMMTSYLKKPFVALGWLAIVGTWFLLDRIGPIFWLAVFALAIGFGLHAFGVF